MRIPDASSLLCRLISEMIRNNELSNENETIIGIYPSFYNLNIRLFGKVIVDHVFGLLFYIGMLIRKSDNINISITKVNKWNLSALSPI